MKHYAHPTAQITRQETPDVIRTSLAFGSTGKDDEIVIAWPGTTV